MENYDSKADTLTHIKRVSELIGEFIIELIKRQSTHDLSKLESPEKEKFDELTPRLKKLTYNSPEYKASLTELGEALKHHYENNSHHPEHYGNGIDGMNLFDIMEMFVDWKAATERHDNGDINNSIIINQNRFNMSPQLTNIFNNTVEYLGWSS